MPGMNSLELTRLERFRRSDNSRGTMRPMTMGAIKTAVLLSTTLLTLAGCTSAKQESSQVINFDKHSKGGVILRKASDVKKLKGTPADFQQFMAGVIDTDAHWGSIDKQCPTTISVEKYDTSGYALGGIGDCGGAVLMWGKHEGIWQQVWGGQDIPACNDLKKFKIPNSVAGKQCWDGKKAVTYSP
jgi:hypothetical protein